MIKAFKDRLRTEDRIQFYRRLKGLWLLLSRQNRGAFALDTLRAVDCLIDYVGEAITFHPEPDGPISEFRELRVLDVQLAQLKAASGLGTPLWCTAEQVQRLLQPYLERAALEHASPE